MRIAGRLACCTAFGLSGTPWTALATRGRSSPPATAVVVATSGARPEVHAVDLEPDGSLARVQVVRPPADRDVRALNDRLRREFPANRLIDFHAIADSEDFSPDGIQVRARPRTAC